MTIKEFLIFLSLGCLFAASAPRADTSRISPLALVAQGDYDAARRVTAQTVANDPAAPLHMGFLEAAIAKARGNAQAAADICRDLLKIEPKFEPARRLLFQIETQMGHQQAAAFHARKLFETTADPIYRAKMAHFLDRSGWGKSSDVSLRFSARHSDNVNGGATQPTVTTTQGVLQIDPESRAIKSDVMQAGLTAWATHDFAPNLRLRVTTDVDHIEYSSPLMPDQTTATFRTEMIHAVGRHTLRYGAHVTAIERSTGPYAHHRGVSFSTNYVATPRLSFGFSTNVTQQKFAQNDDMSGRLVSGELSLRYWITPSMQFSIGLPVTQENTQRDDLDHVERGISAGVSYFGKDGWTVSANLGAYRDTYGGPDGLIGTTKWIEKTVGQITASNSTLRVGNFYPELTVTRTLSKSNHVFSDYDRTDMSFAIRKTF